MATDEVELFTLPADQPIDVVWPACGRAVATMDLRDADDGAHTARCSTGVSWTSWAEHVRGRVEPPGSGARIVMHGRPKGSALTTDIGEEVQASGVGQDIECYAPPSRRGRSRRVPA